MFWRGVFGYLPVQLTQAAVGFGSVIVFTRLLTPEQYGQYALALASGALFHSVLLVWLEAAMERFTLPETRQGAGPAHFTTLHLAFALVAVAAVAIGALVVWLLPIGSDFKLALAAGLASATASSGFKLMQERRRAQGRVSAYAGYSVLAVASGFVLGAVMAQAGWGAVAPLAGSLTAYVLCGLAGAQAELKLAAGGRFEPGRLSRYAAYGLPVGLSLILTQALFNLDRFLIAGFLDEAAVGYYQAGYGLAYRTLDILFVWIGLAGGPALIAALERGGPAALQQAARLKADVMVLICLPAAVGLALVARPLAEVMVGEELRAGAARVIPWIAVSGFFGGLTTHYLDHGFTLARRSGLLLMAMLVPASCSLGLNLLLIPRFGLDGAMWASSASFAAGAAASWLMARRAVPLPLPWSTLARAGLAAVVMAAAVLALPALGGVAELALKAAAGALVYGLAALLLDVAGLRSQGLALLASRPVLRRA
jgi:O-antigen/teichoic acid export membrane protein